MPMNYVRPVRDDTDAACPVLFFFTATNTPLKHEVCHPTYMDIFMRYTRRKMDLLKLYKRTSGQMVSESTRKISESNCYMNFPEQIMLISVPPEARSRVTRGTLVQYIFSVTQDIPDNHHSRLASGAGGNPFMMSFFSATVARSGRGGSSTLSFSFLYIYQAFKNGRC